MFWFKIPGSYRPDLSLNKSGLSPQTQPDVCLHLIKNSGSVATKRGWKSSWHLITIRWFPGYGSASFPSPSDTPLTCM